MSSGFTKSTSGDPRRLANHDERLRVLHELMRNVSLAKTPAELAGAFVRDFFKIHPREMQIAISTRDLAPGEYKVTRRILPEEASRGDLSGYAGANPWRDWDQIPTYRGGFIGQVIEKSEPQLFQNLDVEDDPVIGPVIRDMGSCIASPLYDTGEPMNWALIFRREPDGFTEDSLEEAFLVGNLVGAATRNLLALRQNERLAGELTRQFEEVARVQQRLLPKRMPTIADISLATSYLTSDHAGGDYFDFLEFGQGKWGILIADVSGHGAAAATVSAMLHSIVRAYDGDCTSPEGIMKYANKHLVGSDIEGMFITAYLGVYDETTGEMVYARAGHTLPRLREGGSGAIRQIGGPAGPPLGLFVDGFETGEASVKLEPGDTLVLYTDGITEAFSATRDMFGTEGLDAAIAGSDGSPQGVIDKIHGALFAYTGARSRDDDQTIVTLRRHGLNVPIDGNV